MKTYIVQITPEGGANGIKIITADEFEILNSGAIVFFVGADIVCAFSSFIACVEQNFALEIEAATNEFNANNI